MRSRRVFPYVHNADKSDDEPVVKVVLRRGKKVGKWAAMIVGIPVGYIWLPLSCCFRNPVSMVVFGNDPEDKFTAADKMSENLGTILYGCAAFASCCCCCFGCCGSVEPSEV
jgi:hypothetical protein